MAHLQLHMGNGHHLLADFCSRPSFLTVPFHYSNPPLLKGQNLHLSKVKPSIFEGEISSITSHSLMNRQGTHFGWEISGSSKFTGGTTSTKALRKAPEDLEQCANGYGEELCDLLSLVHVKETIFILSILPSLTYLTCLIYIYFLNTVNKYVYIYMSYLF